MTPIALIIRTAGTNCDAELAHAFDLAGAAPVTHHLNELIARPHLVERADLIGLPGGFSYGDDIAAGRILASRLRRRLMEPLLDAIKCGVPIIGICNGFQALVKMGLLPDPQDGGQTATLTDNADGRFVDRWIGLEAPDDTACIWTKGLARFDLPIAHGEGRFTAASDESLAQWRDSGQVALRYGPLVYGQASGPANPNGSADDIAGVCDPTGLVLGLMPHPERCTHFTHHPDWSRLPIDARDETPAGLRLFQNAVAHVKAANEAKTRESVATGG